MEISPIPPRTASPETESGGPGSLSKEIRPKSAVVANLQIYPKNTPKFVAFVKDKRGDSP
jgi:hypothetical protein